MPRTWHSSTNIADRERRWRLEQHEVPDPILFRSNVRFGRDPIAELSIRGVKATQEISNPRPHVVGTIIEPPDGRLAERRVVLILGLEGELFDADVAADPIAGRFQQHRGEQTGHAPVAVIEWVDAQQVERERRHHEKWVLSAYRQSVIGAVDKFRHEE